jgi:hypothetical protein
MPTQMLNVSPAAWLAFDPGTQTVMGFENADPKNQVVVFIGAAAPADVHGSSETGHTLQPKQYRDFNFLTGEKAYLRSLGSYAVWVAAL